ncbi:hypothetical protein BDK51DRAFT_38424 [Blyttiomyces helicus]|uniref:FCH domain-containing protein n=1 Tax=Blyttiomyces helicus TaxID=388810 RepID=A0A4P9W3X1_9FUNG|nr:hypothetical protein BDK51DRAFT_38424 [Blyttiomyces helicus]|eukprot:RKO86552.1 hypothetical protein BDK51DRAFT_38424 [Blyttiomyces helicus]
MASEVLTVRDRGRATTLVRSQATGVLQTTAIDICLDQNNHLPRFSRMFHGASIFSGGLSAVRGGDPHPGALWEECSWPVLTWSRGILGHPSVDSKELAAGRWGQMSQVLLTLPLPGPHRAPTVEYTAALPVPSPPAATMRFVEAFSFDKPKETQEIVSRRLKKGRSLEEEVASHMKERADIEERYASDLLKLSKKSLKVERDDVGTMWTVWEAFLSSTATTANIHGNLAREIVDSIARPLMSRQEADPEWSRLKQVGGARSRHYEGWSRTGCGSMRSMS